METIGICPECWRAVRRLLDGSLVSHNVKTGHCPGSAEQPAVGTWLPIKEGLTPARLSGTARKPGSEDGIPEILAEQRLGH